MSGQQLDFKDLVTVVTGAGGGIGKVYAILPACCLSFVESH